MPTATVHIKQSRRMSRLCLVYVAWCMLTACSPTGTPSEQPIATPTSVLAPYNAAVATAEAAGDPRAQAQALYQRGNVRLDQGDNDAAIADYTASIRLDATNARAFNNRALAYVALGQLDRALPDYAEAIRIDPKYIRAYQNRLHLLEQRGDLKGVAADYGRLAAIDAANRADYLYRQGSALRSLRDPAGARHAFDAALVADPRQVDALYERGLLSLAAHNLAAAIADLDAALRLSPRAANAYYARGLARADGGNHAAAITDFTEALRLQAKYPDALLGRAIAYHALAKDAEARADLDRLAGMPGDAALQAAAAALRQQLARP